jgi:hypothetical protein
MYYSIKCEVNFFREAKQIYSSYFIFSHFWRLRFQLLFILKDEPKLENIFLLKPKWREAIQLKNH